MENIFYKQQLTHLALAQYHRWYQVYEVPFTDRRIANQKDILSDDVVISSQAGTAQGKEGLEERLSVFEGWLNAHHVQKADVKLLPNGQLSLEADILYQNIRPDQSRFSYTLHYSTLLATRNCDLPLFTKVDLQATGIVDEFRFEEAYSENRVQSFLHYWLYLMEQPDVLRHRELLTDSFSLELSDGQTITTIQQFNEWMGQATAQVATSSHQHKNLIFRTSNEGFEVSVDLEWKAIRTDGKKIVAETHHQWVLSNNMDERFARMKQMKVVLVKPYQVVNEF